MLLLVTVYTLGVWNVTAGKEADFVAAWHSLGQWTLAEGYETHGTLLRDHVRSTRFVSFWPWRSIAEAERWQSHREYEGYLARIRETLESVEPTTLDVVLSVS
jgi:heme-degrading monooxygenase HmoA